MNFAGTPTFCTIAPIDYSHLVSGRAAHLVLAHLMDPDHYTTDAEKAACERYTAWVKSESEAGSFIMMDNSAYELKEPYSPDKLITLGRACGASAIVLPDYPFQPAQKTIDAAIEFAPQFHEAGFKTFFVPQSTRGDKEDWIRAYEWAAGVSLIDIIGISILGVPCAWSDIEPAYARVVAMHELQTRDIFDSGKHHHFLGLNAGPALEIPTLLRMGVLDTIDSSGPVFAGIQGHRYTPDADSYQSVKKLTHPVDFFMKLSKDEATLERIQHNISMTDAIFTNYMTTAVWYAEE